MDIWERIRHARDRAREAENTEKQRLADADTVELQRAASVRLATRQAVREALDDILGDEGGDEGTGSDSTGSAEQGDEGTGSDSTGSAEPGDEEGGSAADEESTPLTGTSTSVENAEPSYAGAGTPTEGDVQEDPGSQSAG